MLRYTFHRSMPLYFKFHEAGENTLYNIILTLFQEHGHMRLFMITIIRTLISSIFTYCGWLNFRGVPIFVVFVEGSIHEFQYPQINDFLHEL